MYIDKFIFENLLMAYRESLADDLAEAKMNSDINIIENIEEELEHINAVLNNEEQIEFDKELLKTKRK